MREFGVTIIPILMSFSHLAPFGFKVTISNKMSNNIKDHKKYLTISKYHDVIFTHTQGL